MLSDPQKRGPTTSSATPASEPEHAGRLPPARRRASAASPGLRRHLRRHLRRRRRWPARRRPAGLPRRGPVPTRWRSRSRSRPGQGGADPHPQSWEDCETCHGTGAKPGTSPRPAPPATAAGTVHMRQGFFSIQQTCPHCHGSGKIIPEPCTTCGSGGRIRSQDAGGEDPRRHRRGHAHPLGRQRRAGHQRRPPWRPVHRDPRQSSTTSSSATATTCTAPCRSA